MAKLLGARGIRSAFETTGIIIVLFTLSWPLAVALLVSAPLLTPLIAQLGRRIGTASKASQVRGYCGAAAVLQHCKLPGDQSQCCSRVCHLVPHATRAKLDLHPCRLPPTKCRQQPTKLWRTCVW